MPATKLVELYELKIVSPVEAVKEALARIAEIDGDVALPSRWGSGAGSRQGPRTVG